jgi:hypothetical protein
MIKTQRGLTIHGRQKAQANRQNARKTGKYAWVTNVAMSAITVVWTSSQCAVDTDVRQRGLTIHGRHKGNCDDHRPILR